MDQGMEATWEEFLGNNFPGYLLPSSARHGVSEQLARAFLESLGVRARDLELLKLMSLLAGHLSELEAFATYWLPELIRVLRSRSLVKRREWRGGYQGRLDVAGTLARRMGGEPDCYVTRSRYRDLDLPENVFVKTLAERTEGLLGRLHSAELLRKEAWTRSILKSLSDLQRCLEGTALREVSSEPIGIRHIQAASHARHRAYAVGLTWYKLLSDALDSTDPEKLAKILATGALLPMDRPKRFEVAVVLALLNGLRSRLPAEDGWELESRLIASGRKEVALFRRGNTEVGVYYDQAVLPLDVELGPRDSGVAHYLGSAGRLRPDVTVRTKSEDGAQNFTVFEIKLSDDPGYLASGYGEAIVYRHEYAEYLKGWPKAVVVASCEVRGEVLNSHEVVAVQWSQLASSEAINGILDSL